MKKHIERLLLLLGIILLCISVVLVIMAVNSINIIGGADIFTFLFVFFQGNGGLYFIIALLGFAAVIASGIISIVRKRK